MTYTYFFDNNIYRCLTTSPNGLCFKNFITSVKNNEILREIDSKGILIKMTPFSVMEALGITAPKLSLTLPPKLIEPKDIIEFLFKGAKEFYQNSPYTKKEHFLIKAKEQSRHTSAQAKELENMCIKYPLNKETFEDYLIACLTFDYIYKYNFIQTIELKLMAEFFIPSFFADNKLSSLSKFRVVKKMWDMCYSKLLSNKDYTIDTKKILMEMNEAIQLKKDKDYLDCELIHLVTIGDYIEDTYNPVVVFTCDDEEKIKLRIMTYKSTIPSLIKSKL